MKRTIVAILATLVIGVLIGHNTNIYAGQNIGIMWGNCGIEVKGHVGTFCNVD